MSQGIYFSIIAKKYECEKEATIHCSTVMGMGSSLASHVKCADDYVKKCEKMIENTTKTEK